MQRTDGRGLAPGSGRLTRIGIATAIALAALAALSPAPADAFKISGRGTFLGDIAVHGDPTAIHEQITETAIRAARPKANATMVLNIQRGVENTDVTHQWDSEYHFDNASVAANVGFREGFAAVTKHFRAAVQNATANPQFLKPTYRDFAQIATATESTLRLFAKNPGCVDDGRCPADLRRLAEDVEESREEGIIPSRIEKVFSLVAGRDNLKRNPYPDPHRPTGDRSPFADVTITGCSLCGRLAPVNLGYVDIVRTVERSVETGIARAGLYRLPGLRRKLVVLRDAIDAYRAFQDLGHAFHTSQDFFAHTNYVELMAGVAVEQPIPAGTQIPITGTFNLAGLRTVMGDDVFALLESGAVVTNWLGEGDFCAGHNLFNPDGEFLDTVPLWLGRLALVFTTGVGAGENPAPPPGFHYCHYHTAGAAGLNKDEPATAEPSSANHAIARDAATRLSEIIWRAFLVSIKADDDGGATGVQKWSGQWDFKQASGVTGGFAFRHESDDNGADLLERIGGKACAEPSDYFAGGFTVPDDEALPPGESFIDTGKIRGCTVGGPNRIVGRYQSNNDDAIRGDIDLTLDGSGKKWRGTFTLDGTPGEQRWEGTFDEHFDGDGATEPSE